ncbi:MAG TPA: PQQ-dependent sugar dehydrogenase [Casimicrobiaceae bacterium]|nr:PQQ-dependent sugar dehydrogenase [Casimicrobiaceae bacterium]
MTSGVRALLPFLLAALPTIVRAVDMVPVVSGLSTPVFVTSARDGSSRLFVVERQGIVRVVQPNASSGTVFLDVRDKVVVSNEQGLLGLAFHPAYGSNGRLFVYYTRRSDGGIVIAEYRRSANANAADPAESVLLVIPHPGATNHNGGMLAFGPDGYLYAGVGDGGSANDPPNNAQNVQSLLGKILRIDIDRSDPALGTPYAAPADNPFVNANGRDEIFAIGLRNPWRFSFDSATGALWVGDVGQGAREEVHAPVVKGGNYGWRVYEGTRCTGNDPSLCNPTNFTAPLFEYSHTGGRCSITGGYVYRGARGTFAPGTYVYGDFCSGEIFAWDGSAQALLVDTTMSVASFGEDEEGELYVVDLSGMVSRFVNPDATSIAVEYVHAAFGHYFVTSLPNEIAALDNGTFSGWARTGLSFAVAPAGAPGHAAMCRFFSASFAPKSSHFYTPFTNECDGVRQNARWQFEGDIFAVLLPDAAGNCTSSARPLYRLYNNGQGGAPNHRYTASVDVRARMLAQGWVPEGLGSQGVIGCVAR